MLKVLDFHSLKLEKVSDTECPRFLNISKKSTHLIKSLNLNNKKSRQQKLTARNDNAMNDKEKARIKLILSLELKITHSKEYVKKEILTLKQKNIHSPEISAEEASYNVGAVDHLTKVLDMLNKPNKDFL